MILITGGLGYIGSNTVVEFIKNNEEIIIIDNLYNSTIKVLENIEKIVKKKVKFYNIDLLSINSLKKVFIENEIDAIIHFAGYKAVAESVKKPLEYYDNNINSTINLLKMMEKFGTKYIIFSSSACVYGMNDSTFGLSEDLVAYAYNPYGKTKLYQENIIKDYVFSNKNKKGISLRYFNPIGSDETLVLGDLPNGIPNNLMPYILKVMFGELDVLTVYGDDYNTKDGTCLRDYIHVSDLARGHYLAYKYILKMNNEYDDFNLGTGKPTSVLDIINSIEKMSGKKVNYKIGKRRDGDVMTSYANTKKSEDILLFKTKYSIDDMTKSSYLFYEKLKNEN